MGGTATYLYGIVHAARRPAAGRAPAGVPGGSRVTVHAVGRSLWVIAADVPLDTYGPQAIQSRLRDMEWVAQVAIAHENVVEHFSRQRTSTVLPMKLFTLFSTVERTVAETGSQRRAIGAAVKRIAGCEEWGVRMTRVPAAARVARRAPRADSGAAFLAAKKQARDAERERLQTAAGMAQSVFDTLAAIAREARSRGDVPAEAATPPLLDAAFLVPVGRRAKFKTAARRLAAGTAAAGAEVTVTGPWPAYNFVQLESRP